MAPLSRDRAFQVQPVLAIAVAVAAVVVLAATVAVVTAAVVVVTAVAVTVAVGIAVAATADKLATSNLFTRYESTAQICCTFKGVTQVSCGYPF